MTVKALVSVQEWLQLQVHGIKDHSAKLSVQYKQCLQHSYCMWGQLKPALHPNTKQKRLSIALHLPLPWTGPLPFFWHVELQWLQGKPIKALCTPQLKPSRDTNTLHVYSNWWLNEYTLKAWFLLRDMFILCTLWFGQASFRSEVDKKSIIGKCRPMTRVHML